MDLKLNPKIDICRGIVVSVLLVLLLVAFVALPFVAYASVPSDRGYTNIDVNTAYRMIRHKAFSNLVILDVRSEQEYRLGHLYDAIPIPHDELESRINELREHLNHEIIVYCKSGGRSQIACEILVEYGFKKVYNMIGGIDAWIEAGYPIYTTYHYVTVDRLGRRIVLDVKPLLSVLQIGCPSCSQNCNNNEFSINVTSTVLQDSENYTEILFSYEFNGSTFEFTVAKTLLWGYHKQSPFANRTAKFILTEIKSNNVSMQFYTLSYIVQHRKYNLTVLTTLTPSDSQEAYNSSFTTVNYAPAGKSEVVSMEFVEFNTSVTLSQLYKVLSDSSKTMSRFYLREGIKNSDINLIKLAINYHRMKLELSLLYWLTQRQLKEYDKEILDSSATLMDDFWSCLACTAGCYAALGGGCFAVCFFSAGLACWVCSFLLEYPELLLLGCDAFCNSMGWCP